jgi:hypothetical protein
MTPKALLMQIVQALDCDEIELKKSPDATNENLNEEKMLKIMEKLKSRRKLHVTVKLFIISLFLQWFSLLFAITYNSTFASSGEANSRLQVTSDVFASISESIFLLVLICLAKGWTIVRRKISINGRLKIACFLTTYFMSSLTVVVWKHVSRNSATQIYYYESPAGIMYVCARCFALVWFCYSAKTTMVRRNENTRLSSFAKTPFTTTSTIKTNTTTIQPFCARRSPHRGSLTRRDASTRSLSSPSLAGCH